MTSTVVRLLTSVLCLAAVGSAVTSRLLGTWFGYVPVETDPGYVRAMRLFGLRGRILFWG